MECSGGMVTRRPGMATFAAIIMFLVAGFEVLSAILAFGGSGWWVTETGTWCTRPRPLGRPRPDLRAHRALCGDRPLARRDVWSGYGLPLRWPRRHQMAFCLPAAPILSVVVIALCVMVIYGLATHSDYVESA